MFILLNVVSCAMSYSPAHFPWNFHVTVPDFIFFLDFLCLVIFITTEALNATFDHTDWEDWDHSEGITFIWSCLILGGSYSFMSCTTIILFVEIFIFSYKMSVIFHV